MQPESQKNEIQIIINNMVFLLGLNSEIQLGDFIGVTSAAITKWKKRGKIPNKYQKLINETIAKRTEAIDSIKGVSVSVQEVMDALGMKKDSTWIYQYKKKNPRLYELIEDGIRLEKIKAVNLAIKMATS